MNAFVNIHVLFTALKTWKSMDRFILNAMYLTPVLSRVRSSLVLKNYCYQRHIQPLASSHIFRVDFSIYYAFFIKFSFC